MAPSIGLGIGVGFTRRRGANQAPPGAPVPQQEPVASAADNRVGTQASTTNGTWTNSPTSYACQWRRDGTAIAGATGQTYTFVPADIGAQIRCTVTATNAAGSNFSNSNSLGPVVSAATAPARMTAPALTPGDGSISVDRANTTADGGSAITRYDLRYATASSMAGATTIEMTSDPQTIAGLTNATAYFVQTRAVNAIGAGEWSDAASATPVAAALPSFNDDFNRADDTGLAIGSANWTLLSGNGGGMRVTSNQIEARTGEAAYASPDLGSANHAVEYLLTAPASTVGPFLAARLVDQNSFVGVRFNTSSGAVQLWKREAGTLTSLSNGSGAAAGKMLRLEVVGDMAQVLLDGAVVIPPIALGGAGAGVTRQGQVARTSDANPLADNYRAINITALTA